MKEQIKDTRLNINVIKGIVILGVVIGHYLGSSTDINASGYATQWIILFYVTSGYGIYYSLQRRFSGDVRMGKIVKYYFDRFMRIMPLFYFVIIFFIIFYGRGIPDIYTLLGIRTRGVWFIASIMHAYLFSVPLFFMMRKSSIRTSLIILTAGFVLAAVVQSTLLSNIPALGVSPFVYLGLFGGHIYIFGLGMLLAGMKGSVFTRFRLIVAFAVFLTIFLLARLVRGGIVVNVVYMFLATWFTGVFIHTNLAAKMLRIPAVFGKYSLSIYLIHSKVIAEFSKSGILTGNDLWSIYMLAILIPVVLLIAVVLELFVTSLVHSARYSVLTNPRSLWLVTS